MIQAKPLAQSRVSQIVDNYIGEPSLPPETREATRIQRAQSSTQDELMALMVSMPIE